MIGGKNIDEWLVWAKLRASNHNPLGMGVSAFFAEIDG